MPATSRPPEHAGYNAANPPEAYSARRAALRRERIAARAALPPAEHARLSALLEAHLEREFAARAAGAIAFCLPIRGEFDARPLVVRLLAEGWRAAVPTVVVPGAPMVFRPWTPATPMAADPYGIPVPAAAEACAPPDVILLPLVAFDAHGYRLGYGGGYFDRTLAALALERPEAVGVGFELARVDTTHPQAHDIPLDAVVTEAGFRRVARPRGELR
jgi:5-formyltetrahydrofolate cyclo-ligase